MNFEQALAVQLATNPTFRKSAAGRRVQRIFDAPPRRKARALARMEEHAMIHLNFGGEVDWGAKAIDWTSLLEFLKAILPIILALFGI